MANGKMMFSDLERTSLLFYQRGFFCELWKVKDKAGDRGWRPVIHAELLGMDVSSFRALVFLTSAIECFKYKKIGELHRQKQTLSFLEGEWGMQVQHAVVEDQSAGKKETMLRFVVQNEKMESSSLEYSYQEVVMLERSLGKCLSLMDIAPIAFREWQEIEKYEPEWIRRRRLLVERIVEMTGADRAKLLALDLAELKREYTRAANLSCRSDASSL